MAEEWYRFQEVADALGGQPIKREKVEKLRVLVAEHGVSIAAASREVGISRVTAYKYLAG